MNSWWRWQRSRTAHLLLICMVLDRLLTVCPMLLLDRSGGALGRATEQKLHDPRPREARRHACRSDRTRGQEDKSWSDMTEFYIEPCST